MLPGGRRDDRGLPTAVLEALLERRPGEEPGSSGGLLREPIGVDGTDNHDIPPAPTDLVPLTTPLTVTDEE
jgi:hypothetical protein